MSEFANSQRITQSVTALSVHPLPDQSVQAGKWDTLIMMDSVNH